MLFLLTSLSTFLKHLRVSGILSTRCDPRVLGAYKTESPNYNEQKPREHISQDGAGPEINSGGGLTSCSPSLMKDLVSLNIPR